MKKITALENKRGTVRVYLDGTLALTLRPGVALRHNLAVDMELSEAEFTKLAQANSTSNCLLSAERMLAYRPQSEHELRTKLARRFPQETIDPIIDRLKEKGLINDASFSEYWTRMRQEHNPRSQRLVGLELRRKGVKKEDLIPAAAPDETESAYRAAQKRIRHFTNDEKSQRKMADFLRRRGFNYEVIKTTLNKIVKEQAEASVIH